MAARRERGLYDPDSAQSPFDHRVYAICSDGDIEEGVSHEVSAIAGHQKLGNLLVIWDDNQISIEDDTNIAKSDDVAARYAAYGWHVQHVDWRGPDGYHEDVEALYRAIEAANAVTDRPSFISLRTIIGWPAPNKQNTGKIHGSALGKDEVAATKQILGFNPESHFDVSAEVLEHSRMVSHRGGGLHQQWLSRDPGWAAAHPDRAALFTRMEARALPNGWAKALPSFPADPKGIATRAASGRIINALAPVLPELWGGSADLAESNLTTIKGDPSFGPPEFSTKEF